jgi:hypothetical protein
VIALRSQNRDRSADARRSAARSRQPAGEFILNARFVAVRRLGWQIDEPRAPARPLVDLRSLPSGKALAHDSISRRNGATTLRECLDVGG